jgi:acyl carrier protein
MKQISKANLIEVICESADGANPEEIGNNTAFTDIPMDSLDIMAALQAVEDAFDASIPDEVMHDLRNLEDLINHLQTQDIVVT